MKKKTALFCFAIALLMQSCSTNKMFSHKRYGHLNWIDHKNSVSTVDNHKKSEQDSETPLLPVKAEVKKEDLTQQNQTNNATLSQHNQPVAVEQIEGKTSSFHHN